MNSKFSKDAAIISLSYEQTKQGFGEGIAKLPYPNEGIQLKPKMDTNCKLLRIF